MKERKQRIKNKRVKEADNGQRDTGNSVLSANQQSAQSAAIQETIKKSGMKARDVFDYDTLVYPMPGLLPCSYKEDLEEVTFTYDITGKKPVSALAQEQKEVQYQFLLNFPMIEPLLGDYQVKLTEENLYYDENLVPYIKERDIYQGTGPDPDAFLEAYKIFIGGILSRKYQVSTLKESGLSLLEQEQTFKEYYQAEDAATLQSILRTRKKAYEQELLSTTVRVKKNSNNVKNILSVTASVLFLGVSVYAGYTSLFEVPAMEKVIGSYEGYAAKDTVASIDSMKGVPTTEMDVSTKYVLAVAYAKSESLKQEEITGIVEKLSTNSNEKELEYWIHLGRLESKEAQDIAKSLSDDKLLLYAYMKELNYLETNTTISGEEKEGRMTELTQAIDQLGEKYTPKDATTSTGKEAAKGENAEAQGNAGAE